MSGSAKMKSLLELTPEADATAQTGSPAMRRVVMARRMIPILGVHIAVAAVLFVHFSWAALGMFLLTYCFLLQGTAGWFHRYFSHRCFRTSRLFQFILAFWGGCAAQRGALWWASHHRKHHAFADQDDDPHSPVRVSFWHSHMSWIWEDANQETDSRWVKDLWRYPELRFLDRNYWIPPLCLWVLIFGLGCGYGALVGADPIVHGLSFLVWGAVCGTVAAWHATFAINSITHLWGRKRYDIEDHSRNNFWVAILNLGEGWHNNHHYYPYAGNSGFFWWEIDPVFYTMVVFEKVGLIRDLKRVPKRVIEDADRRLDLKKPSTAS